MMIRLHSTDSVSFHESDVVGLQREGGSASIYLEDVRVNEERQAVLIRVSSVNKIVRDEVPVKDLAMEHPDGEVLTLESTLQSVLLIVQWNDFTQHLEETRSYYITGESVDFYILPEGFVRYS